MASKPLPQTQRPQTQGPKTQPPKQPRLTTWLGILTARAPKAPQILIYLNLPQDLDVLLPLARQLQAHPQVQAHLDVQVAVSSKAWQQSPRIQTLLAAAGFAPTVLPHKAVVAGLRPRLTGVKAIITASESTASAHRGPHALVQRANRKGILTYTLQHGFENVGISYFDPSDPEPNIQFASRTVFTWSPIGQLPPELPASTREKCVAVGCPKERQAPAEQAGLNVEQLFDQVDQARLQQADPQQADPQQADPQPARSKPATLKQREQAAQTGGDRLIGIFENLHWSRYSDLYRTRFLQDLTATAQAHPNVTFLIKPHHSGQWFTQQTNLHPPAAPNLIIADPAHPRWEAYTAPALIALADLVITTPSTVAVDACRAQCPVAVVANDLPLPNYKPLPLLRNSADWHAVVQQAVRQPARKTWRRSTRQNPPHQNHTHQNPPHRNPAITAGDATSAEDASPLQAQARAFATSQLVPGDAVARIVAQLLTDLQR